MKKIACMLVLLISTTRDLYAQNNSDKTFELAPSHVTRIFYIDLDKGDKIKLELVDMSDLDAIGNLDSILRVFVQDIEPLKDSLADELQHKRIDYLMEASGKNKIRIQQFPQKGSSYLVNQGSVAALKLEQDTVYILLTAPGGAGRPFKKSTQGSHYFRIGFFVNNLSNLASYMNGRLQSSIEKLKSNATGKWVNGKDGMMYSKADKTISSHMSRGQVSGGDYITFRVSADVQNYKNYFVPSLSLGVVVVTNQNEIKREYSFTGESHFTFERDADNKLQTFRSGFLTLGYNQTNTGTKKSMLGLNPAFSFGWLARQRGDIFEKNTFRIGFGKATIGSALKVEPIIYFTDFFKGVTPGIRISL